MDKFTKQISQVLYKKDINTNINKIVEDHGDNIRGMFIITVLDDGSAFLAKMGCITELELYGIREFLRMHSEDNYFAETSE